MAEKKYVDKDGLSYFWQKIKNKIDNKVDKVDGKGLSTNDYTVDEKIKLTNIEDGANKTIVDSELSSTSENPVQNKVVNTAIGNKVDKVTGKGLSANDFTNDLKTKLDGIATGANKTTVDTALSASSTNPVQNKVINTALGKKVDKVNGKQLSTEDFTTALRTKLANQVDDPTNTFVSSVVVDGVSQDVTRGQATIDLSDYARKADVAGAINYQGSVTAELIPTPTVAGKATMLNVSEEFTSTTAFTDGGGKTYPAGTNIVVIDDNGTLKWDVMSGFVDLSPFQKSSELKAVTNNEIDTIVAS